MNEVVEQVLNAAKRGNTDALRLLAKKHGIDAVRADGDPGTVTALHWAAGSGNEETVLFLLSEEIGSDVNARRGNNFTPLHSAAMFGHTHICRLLLARGADPNVQTDPQGYVPMHSAAWGGHTETVRLLMQHGARTDLRNYRDEIPLETARRQGRSEVIALLEGTQTPLHSVSNH